MYWKNPLPTVEITDESVLDNVEAKIANIIRQKQARQHVLCQQEISHFLTFFILLQIRLEPFFHVFDRLRHRHVTRHQFFRVLDSATGNVLHLSADEEAALFNHYSRDDGLVNYRAFSDRICDVRRDVEKIHAPDGLLDDPAATFQEIAAGARGRQLPPADEHHFLTVLLPKLQHVAREQGILVKAHFVDFDCRSTGRTSKISGRVTKAQFLRGLPDKFKEHCTDREIDLLVRLAECSFAANVQCVDVIPWQWWWWWWWWW